MKYLGSKDTNANRVAVYSELGGGSSTVGETIEIHQFTYAASATFTLPYTPARIHQVMVYNTASAMNVPVASYTWNNATGVTITDALVSGDIVYIEVIKQSSSVVEFIQDTAASMLTGGTHSNISFSYDDTNGVLNATATGSGGGASLASTTVSGTVKINSASADPVVYLKSEVDTALTGKAASSHTHAIADLPVASSGTSNTTQLVRADDSRLSNARTPTAHTHAQSEITNLTTDLAAKLSFIEKTLSLQSPTATENITLFYTDRAMSVSKISSVVRGTSPSVTWYIRYGSTRNAASPTEVASSATTSVTGDVITSFTNPSIPANSWVWLNTTAVSGTIDEFALTLKHN